MSTLLPQTDISQPCEPKVPSVQWDPCLRAHSPHSDVCIPLDDVRLGQSGNSLSHRGLIYVSVAGKQLCPAKVEDED